MSIFGEVPEQLLWHEGMLLAPQHLQQQGVYFDQLIRFRGQSSDAYGYGILDLKIDKNALTSGLFRVESCTVILPDGVLVQAPVLDGTVMELDLTLYEERLRSRPLRVEMVIATEGSATEIRAPGRFKEYSGDNVPDLNGAPGLASVPRLVADVRLQLESDTSSRFTTLPIAEVELASENYHSTRYVPPCLRLEDGYALFGEIQALSRRIREKATYLTERIKANESSGLEEVNFGARFLLKGIAHHLAEFEALLDSKNTRPFELYLLICRIAGSSASVGEFLIPPNGRGYSHENIDSSFKPLISFINHCLDEIVQEHVPLPFEETDQGFRLNLVGQNIGPKLVVAARLAAGVSPSETWNWLEGSLISAPDQINDLSVRRALGAARELLPRTEAQSYGISGEVILFEIDMDDPAINRDVVMDVINTSASGGGSRTFDGEGNSRPSQLIAFIKTEDTAGQG
jgi:type VI secretion system protein ImpJ